MVLILLSLILIFSAKYFINCLPNRFSLFLSLRDMRFSPRLDCHLVDLTLEHLKKLVIDEVQLIFADDHD